MIQSNFYLYVLLHDLWKIEKPCMTAIQCMVFAAVVKVKGGFQKIHKVMQLPHSLTYQSQALMDNSAATRACMDRTIPSYFDEGSSTPLLEADTS
jgi:hypothetical protein